MEMCKIVLTVRLLEIRNLSSITLSSYDGCECELTNRSVAGHPIMKRLLDSINAELAKTPAPTIAAPSSSSRKEGKAGLGFLSSSLSSFLSREDSASLTKGETVRGAFISNLPSYNSLLCQHPGTHTTLLWFLRACLSVAVAQTSTSVAMETITKTGPGLFTRTVYDYLKELEVVGEKEKAGDGRKCVPGVTTDAAAASGVDASAASGVDAVAADGVDADAASGVDADAAAGVDADAAASGVGYNARTVGDDGKGAILTSEQPSAIPGTVLVLPYWCFHSVPNDVSVDILDNAQLEDMKAKYVQSEGPLFLDEDEYLRPQDNGANTEVTTADEAIQLPRTHKTNDARTRTLRPSVVHTEPPGRPYAIHWWQRSWQQKT